MKKIFLIILIFVSSSVFATTFDDFYRAINSNDLQKIKQLISNNKGINSKSDKVDLTLKLESGSSVLMMAAAKGNNEIVKMLIDSGADIHSLDSKQDTVLMVASINGHNDIVATLLQSGVNINAKNDKGETALIWSTLAGHTDIVKTLIKYKVDVNIKNNAGLSALVYAVMGKRPDLVKILLDANADIKATLSGISLLALAKSNNDKETINLLKKAGATQ